MLVAANICIELPTDRTEGLYRIGTSNLSPAPTFGPLQVSWSGLTEITLVLCIFRLRKFTKELHKYKEGREIGVYYQGS